MRSNPTLNAIGLGMDAVRRMTAGMVSPCRPTPVRLPKEDCECASWTLHPWYRRRVKRLERKIATLKPKVQLSDPRLIEICAQVSAESGVPVGAILSKSRIAKVARARWKVWDIASDEGMSLSHIARQFGKHPSSPCYAMKLIPRGPKEIAA